ncbi:MAG: guanylate kinase [Alphaproteobacteria bacterium]|nr:guanylate kinase [Alphaproteobacteria bacterium]
MSADLRGPRGRGTRRGIMLILSSPSGTGKTTLAHRLIDQNPDLVWSVSATTRPPRKGETDGEDYFFLSDADFQAKVEAGEFFEHAEVFGRRYGTLKAPVEDALSMGRDVIFDIDWQGAKLLTEQAPRDVVRVFLLPPSLKLLKDRLVRRGQDSEDVINSRMNQAKAEIEHWSEYDYVVINDEFSRALEELAAILRAERLKRMRHPWLTDFVEALLEE